jgi:hypothetical protein
VVAGKQPIKDRRAGRADVQGACRAWGQPDPHGIWLDHAAELRY